MNDTRPPVPYDLPPDLRWEAQPDADWTTDPTELARVTVCRRFARHLPGCTNPVVAVLYRPRRSYRPPVDLDGRRHPARWGYCADHMYGRWIEGGRVMEWVARA